ncbi:MAG: ABC-F family ATP-binding cassette domain-containing protein, partial [Alphaproteobacteria bacterium]
MLRIENLTYRVAGRTILDNASVAISDGHKVGLVGRNGSGKSTLLKLLTGELTADGGTIEVGQRTRVGSVQQEMPEARRTPLAFVLAADAERDALLVEAETATDPQRIADIHTRLADIDAASAEARAAAILAGLGFDEAMQARPLGDFSGGWRMRVALAATLFSAPDLLLLDEPSNHLDLETRIWLESYLNAYRGTILLVSHDRGLLNGVVGSILHLVGGGLTLYRGDYDTFERTRAERLRLQEAQSAKQAAARAHMQAFIDRFRYKASKARQAQSRIKALERMEKISPILREPETRFAFPDPDPLPSPLVTMDGASVGYDGRPVLRKLNLSIGADDRIALLGANGNGKTTFLKLLLGRLQPLSGEVIRAPKVRIGYFEQEQADAFDLSITAFRHMAREMGDVPEAKVRAHLGRFGFPQERADVRIGDLSGGEKARLLFATVTRDAPNILLLDEPTNHLDIRHQLEVLNLLSRLPTTVIVSLHDLALASAHADSVLVLE